MAMVAHDSQKCGELRSKLENLSEVEAGVLGVLRGRYEGATLSVVAAGAGFSPDKVRRALRALADVGLVAVSIERRSWKQQMQSFKLWALTREAWALAARLPKAWEREPEDRGNGVPEELWFMFWSGQNPARMTLDASADQLATAALSFPHPAVGAWALTTLPPDALRKAPRGEWGALVDILADDLSNHETRKTASRKAPHNLLD